MVFGVFINGWAHRESSPYGTPLSTPPINGFSELALLLRHLSLSPNVLAPIYYELPCRSSYSVTFPVRTRTDAFNCLCFSSI